MAGASPNDWINMRIISGIYRGQKLRFPERDSLRPTQEKVRAAVFNILQQQIQGCRFLDLCAGTGSMGIEALSRGASQVHFVDTRTSLLEENLQNLKPSVNRSQIQISQMSVSRALSVLKPNSVDVIFCDPPWQESEIYTEALLWIAKTACLSPTGILFVEHHRDCPPLAPHKGPVKNAPIPTERPRPMRPKPNKQRLVGRELAEAEYMVNSGFGEKPVSRRHKKQHEDSVLQFDDTDGQWSPVSKQASRKESDATHIPSDSTAHYDAIREQYPQGFPLVVSHVYGYSDTHLTRMEYSRP